MAETTGLLNRRTSQAYHEFESRPLRAMQSARQTPHASAAFAVSGDPLRACSHKGSPECGKFGPSARLPLLIAPGHPEMCEAPGRANLVLLRPNPTFTIPPEVAYTPFCRRLCGKARRKCLAFPADIPLRPVCGLKAGKVIFKLGIYRR